MHRLMTLLLCCLLSCGAALANPPQSGAALANPPQSGAALANPPPSAGAANPTLLNTVLTNLGAHTSVRAGFSQTRSNPALAQPQVSHGKLLFVLGHGMLWQTTDPYQETLAMTGSHSARLDAQGHLQPIHNARGVSQISQMLQALLAGKSAATLREFDVQASGTPAQWTLHFTPKQARIARVLGGIELTGDAFLESIRIEMHDGSATAIRFTDTRDAGALDAAEKSLLGLP